MFKLLPRWLFRQENQTTSIVVVDYNKELYIPKGAIRVGNHRPVGEGIREIRFSEIVLKEIRPGKTGQEYVRDGNEIIFCDALILDELVNRVIEEGSREVLFSLFGKNKLIFFFGTTFITTEGEEAVPLLNFSNSMAALRYLYKVGKPIVSMVPCYAAIIRPVLNS